MQDYQYNDIIKQKIIAELKKRNIDFEEIRKRYVSGIHTDRIEILYRLRKDQMAYIIKNIMTEKDKKERQENIKKFQAVKVQIGIPDRREEDEDKVDKEDDQYEP